MSALQKYKKEAVRLAEENKSLRLENEQLKSGLPPIILTPAVSAEIEEHFIARGDEILKRIFPLLADSGGIPLAGSYIAEALFKAYTAGKSDW